MKLSARSKETPESATFLVRKRADALSAQGADVINLGPGEPDFGTSQNIIDSIAEGIRKGYTRYPPAAGIAELREAVAEKANERYKASFRPQNVFISAGAKGVLYHLMTAILDEGDEVIVPAPYWVTYPQQIALAGGRTKIISTEKTDFVLTPEQVESAITKKTVALIINSPSNPTGRIIPRKNLEEIVRLSKKHNFYIISDECYEAYDYDGTFFSLRQIYDEASERIVAVDSFSKTYAMHGWRVGYALGAEKLVDALANIQSHTISNTATMLQYAAAEALRLGGDFASERKKFKSRRDLAFKRLSEMKGIEIKKPEGAFYLFPGVKEILKKKKLSTSAELAKRILDEVYVALVPGEDFGVGGYIRLSYAVPDARLDEALTRMEKFLK